MKIYGAGVEAFALQIKKPLDEAKGLYALYDEKMPFVSQLSNACKLAAQRNGFFKLFNQARRHFNLWAPGGKLEKGAGPCERDEAVRRTHDSGHPWYGQRLRRAETYKALNALIQSAAAIQTKEWMLACWREGVVPLLQMHDSLDCSVSSPEVAEMVARLGEEVIKLEVPMKIDVNYGRTWGDAKHTWEALHGIAERQEHVSPSISIPIDDNRPSETNGGESPPWEETPLAATTESPSEPPHICIHCHQDPPDGLERVSAYNGAWLHPKCEEAFIHARMTEEGLEWQSTDFVPPVPPPPPQPEPSASARPSPSPSSGTGRDGDNLDRDYAGHWTGGSKTEAERDTYPEEHAGEPFRDADLRAVGYRLTHVFDYTLADGTLLYQQNRYELPPGVRPTKKRPRKKFRPHRRVNGAEITGTGDRRVLYNWRAIMRAGPGSTVFVTEGETNAKALIAAGLLATTVLSHHWAPECIAVLTGHHLILLEDHDKEGKALAAAAQRKLAPVAASTRIVPTAHLWKHLPGAGEPDVGNDVQDWIARGGNLKRLLDICREIPADGIISAEPYQFHAETDIPPWQWLYGRHLLRGEVAGTAAMGGTGKSTLSIVEALAMTSSRPLLSEEVPAPLRVVLVNLEDTRNTMDKRIAAVMRQYGLSPAEFGNRLILKAKGEVKIKVARQLRSGDVERNESVIRALTQLMVEHHADVLSIDSFIRTHKVNENDNSAMQEVVECFEDIATEAQCAVHLWHHTRKLGGERATIEAARGASAFVDACRSARVLETMSAKEHEQLREIQPDMLPPGFYFRSFNGKRSFAPPADQSDWFKIESVLLANGDDVGVATPWEYPETWDDAPPEAMAAILDEIDRGMPDGRRYSNHKAATKRAVWPIVQKHCPQKTQTQSRRIIESWIQQGLLHEDEYTDPIYRRPQTGLFIRKLPTEEANAK
jgi:hypothetical protein